MRRTIAALLSCLCLQACTGDSRDESNRSAAKTEEELNVVAPAPDTPEEAGNQLGTSVIRPSVAAEAGPPPPPPLQPLDVTIHFPQGGMSLTDEARAVLDRLIEEPAVAAGGPIVIRGHSDSRGHDGDNVVASAKRAEEVSEYLREKGIEGDRLTVIALGEGRPVAPNVNRDGTDNPEGRALNRRVEIQVGIPGAAAAAAAPEEKGAPVQPVVRP